MISTLIFGNFSGGIAPKPILGRGYCAPPQTQPPWRSGATPLIRRQCGPDYVLKVCVRVCFVIFVVVSKEVFGSSR